jgi:hypothetical protein
MQFELLGFEGLSGTSSKEVQRYIPREFLRWCYLVPYYRYFLLSVVLAKCACM